MARPKTTAVVTQNFAEDIEDIRSRLVAPSGNRIKVSEKSFNFPNGDVATEIGVVIVDFVYMNKYYSAMYNSNAIVPPDCFALSPLPRDLAPSPNSIKVQSDNCAGCPMNKFGTRGAGKACQNRVILAVLPADATSDTPMSTLDVSPTAIKSFSAYVGAVARTLNRPPYGVVTHVGFNQAVTYNSLTFRDPQIIEEKDFIAMIRSRMQEARELVMTEPDVETMLAANDDKQLPKPRKAAGGRR